MRVQKPTPEDIEHLKKFAPAGSCLVIVRRGVSDSGMRRWFDVYSVSKDARWPMLRLTFTASSILRVNYDRKREALYYNGCGFSAPDEIARDLGHALWGQPFEYQEL